MATSDPRAAKAREHHAAAAARDDDARTHRERRDALVRALRAEDPTYWSYRGLARAVGCSPELIAVIIREGDGNPVSRGR